MAERSHGRRGPDVRVVVRKDFMRSRHSDARSVTRSLTRQMLAAPEHRIPVLRITDQLSPWSHASVLVYPLSQVSKRCSPNVIIAASEVNGLCPSQHPTWTNEAEQWREREVDKQSRRGSEFAGDVPVVALTGEIDLAVVPTLQKRLESLLSQGSSTIVVDLLGATFLDSIALGVLVGAMDDCRKAGGDLRLVVTEPRILKVLEITGLAQTFAILSSRQGSSTGGEGQ